MKKTLTSHQHRNQGKLIYLDYRIEHIFGHTSNVYELVITALIQPDQVHTCSTQLGTQI